MSSPAWETARRLLCVRLDSMGDVLMTGPAMRALKQSGEGRQITLLTSASGAAAARRMPEVDEVIVYAAPWMKAGLDMSDPPTAIIEQLRARQFDAAVIFTLHTQSPVASALLCWFAEIPLRAARCRENPYHLLTTWLPEDEAETVFRHDVERQLSLTNALGATTADDRLSFDVRPEDRESAAGLLRTAGTSGRPWCLIHPGASAPSRRYPPALFAAAARSLIANDGWNVIVVAGPGEQHLASEVRDLTGAGATIVEPPNLGTLAGLIEAAPVLIGNNSGPAHLAAAVGTPVVDLYALTNPQHAPWRVPHRLLSHDVPCKFCYKSVCPEGHHKCLVLVDPEDAAQGARELARVPAGELLEATP
jgi:lipopolysaccharide heptosyltransferase II